MLWVILRHSVFLVYQNCVDRPPVRGVQSFQLLARMKLLLLYTKHYLDKLLQM